MNKRILNKLFRQMMPNAGTIALVGMMLFAYHAWAAPPSTPLAAPIQASATSIIVSYQGTLTDSGGDPVNGDVDMVFDLYHEAEGGTSFWTETYAGAQAIEVTDGQFHVLLGSQMALDAAALEGDLYLGITVNGEEMLPREQFVGSVVSSLAVFGDDTTMIEGNLQIGDNSWMPEFAGMDGNDLVIHGGLEQRGLDGARVYKLGIGTDPNWDAGTLAMAGDIDMNNNDIANLDGIKLPFKLESDRSWKFTTYGSGTGTRTALQPTIDNKNFDFRNQDGTIILNIWASNASGGGLNMNNKSITDIGALAFRGHFHISVPIDKHGGFWDEKKDNYILQVGSDTQEIRASRTLNMQGNSVANGCKTEKMAKVGTRPLHIEAYGHDTTTYRVQ